MNILLHLLLILSLTGLPLIVVSVDPVPIQFEKSPVLVASGQDAIFTVQTVPNPSLIRWADPGATTLAMWANSQPVVMPLPDYLGRISVTATQLKISGSKLRDAGNYTVTVEPSTTSGLGINSRSVQLRVFDAVNGVSLSLPTLPLEGGNASLRCSWTAGTEVSVAWGKGGSILTSNTRITISDGSLLISPVRRDDAGEYTCTVSNPVSARTARANLSVYYGPDTPQMTKTSAECVGGGDATVGQTVRLSCESSSLPPASFTWELNGQPVTTGQSGSGVLSLQIFSTNQSGRYVCTARNDITGATSKQQIDLAIVGICLSPGAVAGIVIACFVALIIIIIVIIVLLRQRNADRRLRDAIGLQKTNTNGGPSVPPPQNANAADRVNGNRSDLLLNTSLPQNQENFTTIPYNNDGNINTMAQNRPLQNNSHLNTDVFHPTSNLRALPYNGHLNTNSYPNNGPQNSFPQPGQQNPNILIQTGNSQPGAVAPTVHVNLNTLPRTDQLNGMQPQTVHVNLNTYPPEANQLNQALQQQSDQRQNMPLHQHANSHILGSGNETQTVLNNALTDGSHQTNGLIQTGYTHHNYQTNTNRRAANVRSSSEDQPRHSNSAQGNNQFNAPSSGARLHIPWDRLRGTPAYPNHQVSSSDSYESESSDWGSGSPQPDRRRGRSAQRHRQNEPAGVLTQAASSVPHRRDHQGPTSHSVTLNHSQMDPNPQRQVAQQNISTRPQAQTQSQTAPRHAASQAQTPQAQNLINSGHQTHTSQHTGLPQGTTIPQNNPLQVHAHPQTRTNHPQTAAQFRPDQTQTTTQPSNLTQAALLQHTVQTDNLFTSRNQQTQAFLQNPGAQFRPSQPTQQLNKSGQRAPTPPAVLGPAEFQMLPRERPPQPTHVTKHPVNLQHRHRSPNRHRQTRVRHTSPQRVPGTHPVHANMHGHPAHVGQAHRSRPRR